MLRRCTVVSRCYTTQLDRAATDATVVAEELLHRTDVVASLAQMKPEGMMRIGHAIVLGRTGEVTRFYGLWNRAV